MNDDIIINTTGIEIDLSDIKNICEITFEKEKVINPIYNIIIVGNKKIKEINKKYRNIDKETDVISFAFEEAKDNKFEDIRVLGEIYISIDKAKSQALEYGHSLKREICFLTVHGLLHLLGYDHMQEKDKAIMRKREEEILQNFSISRNTLQ
jgi:probable rRNA maturation factor